jgi:hypothetical protein
MVFHRSLLFLIFNLLELDDLRKLYDNGTLVLNKVNIEKSAAYLLPDRYLSNIKEKKKLTEAEKRRNIVVHFIIIFESSLALFIIELKRNRRKYQEERLHHDLQAKFKRQRDGGFDSNFQEDYEETKGRTDNFEEDLEKFLCLKKHPVKMNVPLSDSSSDEEVEMKRTKRRMNLKTAANGDGDFTASELIDDSDYRKIEV